MMQLFSYGGGVQSNAALVLAARGELPLHYFIFANVGADSENPATLAYVEEIAKPYALAHGLELIEVQAIRNGALVSVLGQIINPDLHSIGIPIRMSNGAPGHRSCTQDFKRDTVAKWAKQQGATIADPADVHLGITIDEAERMRNDSGIAWVRLAYPLIDLRLRRADCIRIIESEGLPVPPKSSCWFCPFHGKQTWLDMRDNDPVMFQDAISLEQFINFRRAMLGKDRVWFTDRNKPLVRAVSDGVQPSLFGEMCDAGYCGV